MGRNLNMATGVCVALHGTALSRGVAGFCGLKIIPGATTRQAHKLFGAHPKLQSGARRRAKNASGGRSARERYRGSKRRYPERRERPAAEADASLPHFSLDIPAHRVHVVDSLERLDGVRVALRNSALMSIDTETQPSFVAGEWHPTSLLQIGTRDATGEEDVILIDLLSFQEGLRLPESLNEALREPLGSSKVLKLGVGVAQDFDDMAFAFKKTPFLRKIPGVLDLNALHRLLVDGRESSSGASLRKLSNMYLGKMLSKGQQRSSWARRPLKRIQVEYAACDVLVTLRIFDELVAAAGTADLHQLANTWRWTRPSIKTMRPEKVPKFRAKLAARARAVTLEHIKRAGSARISRS